MSYADEVKRKIERQVGAAHRQCVHETLRRTQTTGLWECSGCKILWQTPDELERVPDELQPKALERGKDDPFHVAAAHAHREALAGREKRSTKVLRRQWVAGHSAGFLAGWNAALLSSRRVVDPVDLDALASELRAPFNPARAVRP